MSQKDYMETAISYDDSSRYEYYYHLNLEEFKEEVKKVQKLKKLHDIKKGMKQLMDVEEEYTTEWKLALAKLRFCKSRITEVTESLNQKKQNNDYNMEM